ncbi:hypothetical protein DIPPA_31229 [Diplonema papillatum]|nr:hypothetical protein DIPPA_31229 [Diplonema papillatum]
MANTIDEIVDLLADETDDVPFEGVRTFVESLSEQPNIDDVRALFDTMDIDETASIQRREMTELACHISALTNAGVSEMVVEFKQRVYRNLFTLIADETVAAPEQPGARALALSKDTFERLCNLLPKPASLTDDHRAEILARASLSARARSRRSSAFSQASGVEPPGDSDPMAGFVDGETFVATVLALTTARAAPAQERPPAEYPYGTAADHFPVSRVLTFVFRFLAERRDFGRIASLKLDSSSGGKLAQLLRNSVETSTADLRPPPASVGVQTGVTAQRPEGNGSLHSARQLPPSAQFVDDPWYGLRALTHAAGAGVRLPTTPAAEETREHAIAVLTRRLKSSSGRVIESEAALSSVVAGCADLLGACRAAGEGAEGLAKRVADGLKEIVARARWRGVLKVVKASALARGAGEAPYDAARLERLLKESRAQAAALQRQVAALAGGEPRVWSSDAARHEADEVQLQDLLRDVEAALGHDPKKLGPSDLRSRVAACLLKRRRKHAQQQQTQQQASCWKTSFSSCPSSAFNDEGRPEGEAGRADVLKRKLDAAEATCGRLTRLAFETEALLELVSSLLAPIHGKGAPILPVTPELAVRLSDLATSLKTLRTEHVSGAAGGPRNPSTGRRRASSGSPSPRAKRPPAPQATPMRLPSRHASPSPSPYVRPHSAAKAASSSRALSPPLRGVGGTPSHQQQQQTPGSSARLRHVRAAAHTVNVKSFGARGDGKTNDSLAVLAAARAASGSRGDLYFPKGHYLFKFALGRAAAHTVNVKSFGARGYGKTNDSLAVLAAARAASGSRGDLYFPKGHYAEQYTVLYGSPKSESVRVAALRFEGGFFVARGCHRIAPSAGGGRRDTFPAAADAGQLGAAAAGRAVNVKSFGARGDGKTNDSLAVLAAARAASGSRGDLYFPKGHYVIDR